MHWCQAGRTCGPDHLEVPRENRNGWFLECQNLWHAQCVGWCFLFVAFKSDLCELF
jgi:hypothetical protein